MTVVSRRKSSLLTCILLAVGLFLVGCGKPEHTKTEVEPAKKTITVGQSLQLKAVALDPEGEPIAGTEFQWSVEGNSATISDQGLLAAQTPGTVKVLAAAGKVTGTADITIVRQKVATLEVFAEPAETIAGESVQIQVTVQNASGQGLGNVEVHAETSTSGARFDQASAVTDAAGRTTFNLTTVATALANRAEIQADDQTASVEVLGLPGPATTIALELEQPEVVASETAHLLVTANDRAGNVVPRTIVNFAATTPGTSVESTGEITNDAGQARVGVRTNVKSGPNAVEVTAPGVPTEIFIFDTKAGPPAKLSVTPSLPTTVAGGKVELTAEVADAHGNPVSGVAITLASPTEGSALAATALTTNEQGEAQTSYTTAAKPGDNAVISSIAGLGDVTVSVIGNQPKALKVDPENAIVEMKGSQTFQALAMDDEGNRAVVPAQWSVVGNTGSIDEQAVFTANALGDEAVVATYQGLTGGATLTVVPGTPATVKLLPQATEVVSGENQQFSASAFNAYEHPLDTTLEWSVSEGVGTIDAAGLFTATKAGAGTVTAKGGETSAQATVTVTPGPLATIQVEPSRLAIRAGEEVTIQAEGRDAAGNSVAIEPSWSLTADLGIIDQSGQFHAQHVGSGTIRAEAGSPQIIGEIPVEVVTAALARIEVAPRSLTVSAGEDYVFQATGFDASGNVLAVAPAWTISGDVGTIDTTGKLSARRTGTTTIQAKVDELVATASVTVKSGDLASLEIDPKGPLALQAGATVTLTLIGKDAFGNVIALKPHWQQSQTLGTFEPGGQFRGTKVGAGQLLARVDEMQATVEVTVLPGKLAAIDVEPKNSEPTAGSKITFTAVGRDAYGNAIPIEPTWRITDQIGEITAKGEFTALQARRGEVVATAQGISGSAAATVFPGKLTFLKITPLQIDIQAGEKLSIVLLGYDIHGNPVPIHPVWKIPNDLGTIDAAGTFSAGKAGAGRIIVAAGTLAAVIDTKVSLGEATRLEIVPAATDLRSGATQSYAVEAFDGGGNQVSIGDATWEVEGSIGNVDESGVFTAVVAAKGKLIARAAGLTGTLDIAVTPGPAANLEVFPQSADITAGHVLTVLTRALDAAGNEVTSQPEWTVEGNIGEMFDHGIFRATTTGPGQIVAAVDGVTQAVQVIVEPGLLARIELTPDEAEMEAGETRGFGATGYDAFGNVRDLYPSWSLQGDIGILDPSRGVFKATKTGTGFIVASDQFIAGLAPIRVKAGEVARIEVVPDHIKTHTGEEVQVDVKAYDEYGNLTDSEIEWRMTKRLGDMNGNTFLPTKIGQTELIAAHDYLTAKARVEVGLGRIKKLDVVPQKFTIEAGHSFRAAARAYDEYDNLAEVAATWRVTNDIGVIDAQSGVFTAGKEGQGELIAQVNEISAQSHVTTVPGPVQQISVQPAKAQLASTEQEDFKAIGIDVAGNERPLTVQWAVNSRLGTIYEEGRFIAKGLGAGSIVAYRDGGLIGTAEVTVSPGPVVLMFVTPQPTTVRAGDTSQFKVTGFDANRNPVPNLSPHWRAVGHIGEINDRTGAFTGTLVGWGKVEASAGQAVGNADVRVTPGTPSPIKSRITSSRVDIAADGETTADITVLVHDRYGNPIANVPVTLIARIDDQIDQPGLTNEEGIAVGRIRSSKFGTSEVSAVIGAVRLQNTLRLQFYLQQAAAQRAAAR